MRTRKLKKKVISETDEIINSSSVKCGTKAVDISHKRKKKIANNELPKKKRKGKISFIYFNLFLLLLYIYIVLLLNNNNNYSNYLN